MGLFFKSTIRQDTEVDSQGKEVQKGTTSIVYGTSDNNGGVLNSEPHGHTVIKDGEIVSMRTIEGEQLIQTKR